MGKTINGRTLDGGINSCAYISRILRLLHWNGITCRYCREPAFKEETLKWAKSDDETMKLVEQLTPENNTMEHIAAKNALMKKYGYDMIVDGSDYNLITTILFNPNYSIIDWIKYF